MTPSYNNLLLGPWRHGAVLVFPSDVDKLIVRVLSLLPLSDTLSVIIKTANTREFRRDLAYMEYCRYYVFQSFSSRFGLTVGR